MRDTEAAAGVEHRKTNDPYPMLSQPSEESPFGVQFGEND
jgi:chitin synthase